MLPQADLELQDDALESEAQEPPPAAGESAAAEPPEEDEAAARLREIAALLREELLEGVERIGGRLGELRLDTDLDISHGVVRYLELLKVAALMQRPAGREPRRGPLGRQRPPAGRRDAAAAGDPRDLDARREPARRRARHGGRAADRLARGALARAPSCPAAARALRCRRRTSRPTASARCATSSRASCGSPPSRRSTSASGSWSTRCSSAITPTGGPELGELLGLLDTGWRRAGLGSDGYEGELLEKARAALIRYHERLQEHGSEPVWFERPFSFSLGPHQLRGRVDRVDRLPAAEGRAGGIPDYELIDYKTSRPKSAEQLRDDVQLSLYALAAREDWHLESSRQAYYYVLDDEIVPVPCEDRDPDAVREIVLEVGAGILAQDFEPTPSPAACSMCDYRIVCPAPRAARS